ncbi:hypothetical protein RCG17_09035 [Neobacillus sp. PS3-12]|nr:hypothetical protein [Neobacillus sp. PS3-12]WML54713.1 hypothetical protein RCG17_09035 [Neobacillus sp. PS3-12]
MFTTSLELEELIIPLLEEKAREVERIAGAPLKHSQTPTDEILF